MRLTKEMMVEHARKHDLFIHPKVWNNINQWIKDTKSLNRCPCSYNKPQCPCPESVAEAKEGRRGACGCTVFVTQRYIDLFAEKLGLKQEDFYKPD